MEIHGDRISRLFLVEPRALDSSPVVGGGLGKRGAPEQRIMNYIGVASIDGYVERVISLGGTLTLKKTAVPGFGHLTHCMGTEGNAFGLWQEDPAAR
jgi:predicted enzyme related to lactoylglutathione lyase